MINPFRKKVDEHTRILQERMKTANDFVNIRDIQNDMLYTKDGYIFAYLRIEPISLELLSTEEEYTKGRQFSAEFSQIKCGYKLFSTSRPVDVTMLVENFDRRKQSATNLIRRQLLNMRLNEINDIALNGDILENQFYLILWEKLSRDTKDSERAITRTFGEILTRLKGCGMGISQCNQADIIKLLNLIANPNYAYLEDEDINEYIPFVTG
ncbi:MAG: hypothetical protein LBU94_05060 [Clostridiales bacterium]|jgi:hypothetical protein|nr:hypothetical protein [Clostridiales bacterium]